MSQIEKSSRVNADFDISRCVVLDVEVTPTRWTVGFARMGHEGNLIFNNVDTSERLDATLGYMAQENLILVGFNSIHYDLKIVRAIISSGGDPDLVYTASQQIIQGDEESLGYKRYWYPNHIDLFPRLGGKTGLKTLAANMQRPRLKESPYAWDQVLDDQQWAEVIEYNRVDLAHTYALLQYASSEIESLAVLSEQYNKDFRSMKAPKIGEYVLIHAYYEVYKRDPDSIGRPEWVKYLPPKGVRRPETREAREWYDKVTTKGIKVIYSEPNATGRVRKAILMEKPRVAINGVNYKIGSGGIHSEDTSRWFEADDRYDLISVDVASYYPSMIATKRISPRSLQGIGAQKYQQLLDDRLKVKKLIGETADKVEQRKYKLQADALKLVLNSTFGKFGEPTSLIYDPEAMLAVTVTGQLMLINLIEDLAKVPGVEVINANTDGLYIRVPKGTTEWKAVCQAWEVSSEMTLEYEYLKRFFTLAQNRYASLGVDGKVKSKGASVKTSIDPKSSSSNLVVADAVLKALLFDVPVEKTIYETKTIAPFTRVTLRSSKTRAIKLQTPEGVETLGKVVRWYRAHNPNRLLMEQASGDKIAPGAKGVVICDDLPDLFPTNIDYSGYIQEARKWVLSVQGYDRLDPKFLTREDTRALHDLGLAPCPKMGKQLPPGVDIKRPSYQYDWDRYSTIGTYTGPKFGILIIDVDDPHRFISWVMKGKNGRDRFKSRLRTLENALISHRSDTTPGSVRTLGSRGKFIFRFEGEPGDPLEKIPKNKWLKTRGIEVLYGKDVPSILGKSDDQRPYLLDGDRLTDLPEWLRDGLSPSPRGDGPRKALTDRRAEFLFDMGLQELPEHSPPSTHFLEDSPAPSAPPVEKEWWEQDIVSGALGWWNSGHRQQEPDWPLNSPRNMWPIGGTLEDLKALLPTIEPALEGVDWMDKEAGGEEASFTISVAKCPYEHASGKSSESDMHIQILPDGSPFIKCKHESCEGIPLVLAKLNKLTREKARYTGELPVLPLTPIAESFLGYQARRSSYSVHSAPTGSGKTYAIARVATELFRRDEAVAIITPTIPLCEEIYHLISEMAPDALTAEAIANCFGTNSKMQDDSTPEAESSQDPNMDEYPIYEYTRIIIATDSQFMRKGYSKYLRGIWNVLLKKDKKTGQYVMPPYHLIIDEVVKFLELSKMEIPLAHRAKVKPIQDATSRDLIVLDHCPRNAGEGNCMNCHRNMLIENAGSMVHINNFATRELKKIAYGQMDLKGNQKDLIRHPLVFDLARDFGWDPSNEVRVGTTTMATKVEEFMGKPVNELARRTAPVYIYEKGEGKGIPAEDYTVSLQHMLEFAIHPVLAREMPHFDEEGKGENEVLVDQKWLLDRMGDDPSKIAAGWDQNVIFPFQPCDVMSLRFTDVLPLVHIGRYIESMGTSLIMTGADVGEEDLQLLEAGLGTKIESLKYPYGDRKIDRVLIVALGGGHFGDTSMVKESVQANGIKRTHMITEPLERFGKVMAIASKKSTAERIFNAVKRHQPSVVMVHENNAIASTMENADPDKQTEARTILSYARGNLAIGVNVTGITSMVVNMDAFRAIGSFNPQELTREQYADLQEKERLKVCSQVIGRGLRGEEGKLLVIFLLNATDREDKEKDLAQVFAESPAILEGSRRPPVILRCRNFANGIQAAIAWMEQGGPDEARLPEGTQDVRGRGKLALTDDQIRERIDQRVVEGAKWRDVSNALTLHKHHRKEEFKTYFEGRMATLDTSV